MVQEIPKNQANDVDGDDLLVAGGFWLLVTGISASF